jgi:hypothetical protein
MNDRFKKKYNFGKHYALNLDAIDEQGNLVNNLIQKIHVTMQENLEDAVCDAIAKEARAQGITDLFVLDKKRIMSALERQIPKKPLFFDSVPHARCPVCKCSVKLFADAHESHFCLYCGQKLDWD